MPTRIPNGLYSGEAAVFNTQPYVQFYSQHLAQKQAKDEALDKYFSEQYKGLTPTGMRSQDIGGLTAKTGELQDFYQKNKEAIKNPRLDNGKSISEYQSRHQDALGYIAQSKDRAAMTKQLSALRTDPDKADRFTDETIRNLEVHDLPLNDQGSKAFDLNSLTYNAKPFDAKSQEAYNKAVTLGLKPSSRLTGSIDLPDYQKKEIYNEEYSHGDVKAIGDRAGSYYNSDPSIKQYAQKQLLPAALSDPNMYNELNAVYKKAYGKDAHTAEELFKAQTMLTNSKSSTTEKVVPNVFGRERAMAALHHMYGKDLIDYKKKIDPNDTEMQNLWVDQYKTQLIDEAKKGQLDLFKYKGTSGKYDATGYRIPLDKTLSDALTVGKNTPDRVYVTKDNKIYPIYLLYDDKGNKRTKNGGELIDEDLSQPITEEQLGVSLGKRNVTGKQRAQEIKSVLNKAGGTTKPSKKDDPLGLF